MATHYIILVTIATQLSLLPWLLTASTLLIVSIQMRQTLALDFIELVRYSAVLPRSLGPISAV